jgi:hypothetical protein
MEWHVAVHQWQCDIIHSPKTVDLSTCLDCICDGESADLQYILLLLDDQVLCQFRADFAIQDLGSLIPALHTIRIPPAHAI